MQRMSKMRNMRTVLLFLLVTMISFSVSAQNATVTGTVKDKTGETVIGASVVQKEIPAMEQSPTLTVILL